jgi:ubiquinone/menaquinone biosynthesis C-methylase UbiE/uncharacterized protein YbaR (Trm112 family)
MNDDLSDVVCPDCHAAVEPEADALWCRQCRQRFPFVAPGVPSLLPKVHERLKTEIMAWWSTHNMDLDWRRPHPEFEKGTWEYFRETDRRWFNWHRPFLHVQYPLLHKFIDMKQLAGRRVLDIGCGVGTMFEQWAAMGANITGIDMAPKHAYLTRQRADLFGIAGRVFHADAERLPFADESFDFAYSWGVIHHTPNTPQAFREIYRVLRPGGRFFVMVYHRHSFHYWYNKMFKWGVLRLKLLSMTPQQVANRSSDGVLYGGNPLSQYLTRAELRAMTGAFTGVELTMTGHADTIRQFPMKRLPLAKLVIPTALAARLMRTWGHLAVVAGEKPSRPA